MKYMLKKFTVLISLVSLAACSGTGFEAVDNDYPKSRDEVIADRVGKLTGEGIVLIGGKRKPGNSATTDSINVNSYLWRATLDTVYSMPLNSADPFGGVIMTDWYQNSEGSRERYKLNIYIIGAELRSDAIRVKVFKQKLDGKGTWKDVEASSEMEAEIENRILLRAREIKVGSDN